MEGLITTRINPVRPYCRRHQSYFVSSYTPQVAKRVIATPIGMMKKHPKLLHSVAASVQPLENSEAGCLDNTLPSKDVLEVWRNADAVCFDVDSTVCLDEGIDELAEFCGAGKAVAEWTARAMGGSVPFEEALAARLSLFNPSLSQVHEFLQKQPPRAELSNFAYAYTDYVMLMIDRKNKISFMCSMSIDTFGMELPHCEAIVKIKADLLLNRISPGIDELIKKLKAKSTAVYLVSGGFRQMINIDAEELTEILILLKPVASILGILPENIFANQLLFGNSGEFRGFDANEPTSRTGGKAIAVEQIKKIRGYKSLVMVGDGATDLEARKPGGADLFICYAGVQLRDSVAAKADWLVFRFTDLINSLQ
ncbi:hypothetical protein RHSIM_Rhsim08G0146000 [Rhododendron simsii]|uniref:phosphoserine phosphatase n=1 Tax=Rhododendron simsii TaxID=118357 RepID=A0A834GGM8_RHOSS|nr:hypothetical protein RHSIM_Rhsim08G0146000 [Rhododendron simsii]